MTNKNILALLTTWTGLVLFNYLASPAHAVTLSQAIHLLVPVGTPAAAESVARAWAARARDLAGWAVVNLGILGAGLPVSRLLGLSPTILRSWLFGLAPLSLAGLGLGLAGLFSAPLLALAAAGIGLASLARFRPPRPRMPTGAGWALLPCLVALPGAFAPEFAFDSLRYHIALPRLFLDHHRIFAVERFLFSGFPLGAEMLYGFGLTLGPGVPKLLNWQFLPAAALTLYGLAAPLLPRAAAVLLTACFSAMPFLGSLATFSNADLGRVAVELGAFACIWRSLGPGGNRLWLSAGWLLGTALGMKYLGAFALGGAALALAGAGRAGLPPFLRRTLPVALALAGIWGLKNLLLTGNPVFPYLHGIFGSPGIEPETLARHLRYAGDWASAHPAWSAWLQLVPVALSAGTYDGLAEALSPALFIAAALLPFVPVREPRERWVLALAGILWAGWAWLGGGIFRFLAPFYPAAFLAAGMLLARAPLPAPAVTYVLALSLAAQLPALAGSQQRLTDPARVAWGLETRMAYINRALPPSGRYLPAMERACAQALGGNLLVLGDPKAYYAPGPCITEFEFAPPRLLHLAATSPDTGRMRIRLRQERITALLYRAEASVSAAGLCDCLPPADALERFQRFWGEWVEPAWVEEHPGEGNFYHCYSLRPAPGRFNPPASALWFNLPGCEQLTQGVDHLLDRGSAAEARQKAGELAARYPRLYAGWSRIALAAPGTPDAARAREKLERMGYGALGR